MIKKHTIGRILTIAAAIFLITHLAAAAADKVVVIPLDSGNCDCDAIQTVTSAGQVWMDRNLGALRVATSSTDYHAYGYLFQWGRLADGHEARASDTTATLSGGDDPGHDDFITVNSGFYDWRNPQNPDLWEDAAGDNNPCPAGFRLPTAVELDTERASWSSDNAAGAFASPLKFSVAGYRRHSVANVLYAGSRGFYWSSTVNGFLSRYLNFLIGNAGILDNRRAQGFSVRCIKD